MGNRRLVSAVNAAAETLGIAPGLPLSDALALHPGLGVGAADPVGDAAALHRLAQWCNRFSPWTAPHGTHGLWLDVAGCAHLRGGEESLAREVVERLADQGVTARSAIADTAGAAWAVARCAGGDIAVVPPGVMAERLSPLPIIGLRLESSVIDELDRLGLRYIIDLLDLPRASLAARFGERLVERLDQALGVAAEPLSPLPPAPPRWSRRRFAEPIDTPEALAAATLGLLETLCRPLGNEQLGARRLALSFHRVDGEAARLVIGTARPSRDPAHLFRLFADRLGEVDPGLGIEDMLLAATAVETLRPAQLGNGLAFPGDRPEPGDAAALAMLVDRLANRLGPQAVGRLLPQESHVPERAVRFVPAFSAAKSVWPAAGRGTRPIRLLPRPEPIEAVALVPDAPPSRFRWRRRQHRVHRADGPERILGEWWRGGGEASALRDYYRVEDEEGRRFWLYRDGLYELQSAPRWFLHGLFA